MASISPSPTYLPQPKQWTNPVSGSPHAAPLIRQQAMSPISINGPPKSASASHTNAQPLTKRPCYCQIGSLKRSHHFGLDRIATFCEQLILQDSVTQSINWP